MIFGRTILSQRKQSTLTISEPPKNEWIKDSEKQEPFFNILLDIFILLRK